MTDNEKLARWQGLYSYRCVVDGLDCGECVIDDPNYTIFECDVAPTIVSKLECKYWVLSTTETPDYLNDDAAAMSLLDALVEKGYEYRVYYTKKNGHDVSIWPEKGSVVDVWGHNIRREAVVAACLELIEKEA